MGRLLWNALCQGWGSNQLCGWIRGIPLFTGTVIDSQMIKDSKILEQYKTCSEIDGSSKKPFANVFYKGFRNALDAAMEEQTCIEPRYSKGGGQFKREDTLHLACVAVIRSRNERVVQRQKK